MAESKNIIIGCIFAVTTFSAFAQTTVSGNRVPDLSDGGAVQTATDPGPLAQRLMDDKLVIWRQRLKLEDWKVSVVMVHRGNLDPNTTGGIRWDKSKKSAVISLLEPSESGLPLQQTLDEMELNMIHELVHLDLAALPHSQASRANEEQAVTGIAEVMMGLDRKKE